MARRTHTAPVSDYGIPELREQPRCTPPERQVEQDDICPPWNPKTAQLVTMAGMIILLGIVIYNAAAGRG